MCCTLPLVPLIVNRVCPGVAALLAASVSVELAPELVTGAGFGLKAPVTPVGSGATFSDTFPVKPATGSRGKIEQR